MSFTQIFELIIDTLCGHVFTVSVILTTSRDCRLLLSATCRTSRATNAVTRRHIGEGLNPGKHHCEKLNSRIVKLLLCPVLMSYHKEYHLECAACPSDESSIIWVWNMGGVTVTGEKKSTGREIVCSVGGRRMNGYGALVEWYWQG